MSKTSIAKIVNGQLWRSVGGPTVQKKARRVLTDPQVAEIRQLSGVMTQGQIAKRYGVNQSHISRVINRERRTAA